MSLNHLFSENSENQLRQYVDAQAVFAAHAQAQAGAAQVRGSMIWRQMRGVRYLIRTTASSAQRSLGAESAETQEMFSRFMVRKQAAEESLRSLSSRLVEMRKLNRVYGVGRTPNVVVSVLQSLARAGVSDQFMTVGTHALYAYESACGVRIGTQEPSGTTNEKGRALANAPFSAAWIPWATARPASRARRPGWFDHRAGTPRSGWARRAGTPGACPPLQAFSRI